MSVLIGNCRYECVSRNELFFLKSTNPACITNLSKLSQIRIEFDESGLIKYVTINKPKIIKKHGRDYDFKFTYDYYEYESKLQFELNDSVKFIQFIIKNMLNIDLPVNNSDQGVENYENLNELEGEEKEFLTKLIPVYKSILIKNPCIEVCCYFIKNNDINLFLLFQKSEGTCSLFYIIPYNCYILNDYNVEQEWTDTYNFKLLNDKEVTNVTINNLDKNNFIDLVNYIKKNI